MGAPPLNSNTRQNSDRERLRRDSSKGKAKRRVEMKKKGLGRIFLRTFPKIKILHIHSLNKLLVQF